MSQNHTDVRSPLEREIQALQHLGAALERSQKALAHWDLEEFLESTDAAQRLYAEVVTLRRERAALPAGTDPSSRAATFEPLERELTAAQARLLHMARVHRHVLRKSNQTVTALLNTVSVPVIAYGPDRRPPQEATTQGALQCRA